MLSENTYSGECPVISQPVFLAGEGKITFESPVYLGDRGSPFLYNGYIYLGAKGKDATIKIGKNTHINNCASIIADHADILVGKGVLIGINFEAYTSDFHSLDPTKRTTTEYEKMNVIIKDNVFIGNNVTVLKGVVIGQNSVIGAGSVVTRSIPENVIAGGIPCKVLREITTT